MPALALRHAGEKQMIQCVCMFGSVPAEAEGQGKQGRGAGRVH